ncbi:MAG: restriction endonuclease subunit S [Flavobacteriales bacterium]
MESEVETYRIAALNRMVETFGDELTVQTVAQLSEQRALFVEDGNHGENRPRQNEFASTGIAFIRPPDLKDGRVDFENCDRINDAGFKRVRKGIGRPGDIILTHRATVGRIAITADDAPTVFVTNPGTTVWRSTKPDVLDQKYLYCFMRSPAFMDQLWAQVGNNSTFDYVSLTQQRGLFVAYPSLSMQKAIAEMVNALDEKIELNRRMNGTLEALAQALFKEWFVDGAKEEWKEKRLSDLVQTQYGYTASASSDEVGPKFLRVTDINKQNWIEWSAVPQCVIEGKDADAYKLKVGDILVARMADPGKSAIIEEEVDAVFASYLVRLKTSNLAQSYFLYHYLKSPAYLEYCEGAKSGTVQLNMNAKVIVAVQFKVPPQQLMDRFLDSVLPLRKRIVANVNESRTLAALRDTLLPKLMRGVVRVKDATHALTNTTQP